uniref:NADH dehydrogenase subunit 2 n=1 Tax=Cavelerius yunnanensis TaxID=2969358 RepID=UPI00205C304A|nr:NADH dehydrogenase subunit 2 [Cavelerius yunnanensis]UPL65533.1 NADH dehydrogenase subunit 2 [Cavelerius excavatus]UUJ37738.1 NADH dehydrogenase subunit 2 [Cavelerius yunnanensis]
MNFSKLIFFMMIIVSSIISLSSKNWMGIWMGMEMNLMFFIPMMSMSKNLKSSKSMMIYFLTQSIGSIIMLFSLLMMLFSIYMSMINGMMKMMIMISLLLKMGAAPFHMWLPKMMFFMKWFESSILLTWQKITPIYFVSILSPNKLIYISIAMSAMIGSIGGIKYSSIMMIMAYSSINHLSWILMMVINKMQWFKYFILYSFILMTSILFFNHYKIYFLNQVNILMSIPEKLTFSSLMLSMGGLPPFLGFLPKWITIQSMINSSLLYLMMVLIMMSLLTLFFYMRIILPFLMLNHPLNIYLYKTNSSTIFNFMLMLNLMFPLFLIFNF